MEPKIISIMGAQRTGKSFLVKKLAEKLNFRTFLEEGSADFPDYIKKDIENNTNGLRRILWFRNRQMSNFLDALDSRANNQGSVLDTFWIDYQMYVDVLLEDLDRDVVEGLIASDKRIMKWPEVIIYLKNSEVNTKKFIELGGRDFDRSENFYKEQIMPLQKKYEEILEMVPSSTKIIAIDRTNLDFENEEDLADLIKGLQL